MRHRRDEIVAWFCHFLNAKSIAAEALTRTLILILISKLASRSLSERLEPSLASGAGNELRINSAPLARQLVNVNEILADVSGFWPFFKVAARY